MTGRAGRTRSGTDRWLVSYANLLTLLLAFFAAIYAASDLDAARVGPAASAIRRALGGADADRPAETVPPPPAMPPVGERLLDVLAEEIAGGRVEVLTAADDVVLSLPEAASFASGSAELNDEARDVLARMSRVLDGAPQVLRVEGHTDDIPIASSRFSSNWELSTARASAVVAFLIERGVEPVRLSAAGYGQFHPRIPNDSNEARAVNRRVDVVLVAAAGAVGLGAPR